MWNKISKVQTGFYKTNQILGNQIGNFVGLYFKNYLWIYTQTIVHVCCKVHSSTVNNNYRQFAGFYEEISAIIPPFD